MRKRQIKKNAKKYVSKNRWWKNTTLPPVNIKPALLHEIFEACMVEPNYKPMFCWTVWQDPEKCGE